MGCSCCGLVEAELERAFDSTGLVVGVAGHALMRHLVLGEELVRVVVDQSAVMGVVFVLVLDGQGRTESRTVARSKLYFGA